jgi:hypothetical protein
MKCRRCNGLLVKDRLYDLYDTHVHLDAWRCLACGDVLDAVILHNRMKQPLGLAGLIQDLDANKDDAAYCAAARS